MRNVLRRLSVLTSIGLILGFAVSCSPGGGGTVGGNDNGTGGGANDNGAGGGNDNGTGGGGDNDNGGGGGGGPLSATQTAIPVRFDAALVAGDDLIVFGTGAVTGVQYVVPSTSPGAGTDFENSADYSANRFGVAGSNIVLLGGPDSTFGVSVFNTVTGTTTTFPETELRAANIPIDPDEVGPLDADGNYAIVANDQTETGGINVKMIDMTGDVPVVVNLANIPDISEFNSFGIGDVRIDGTARIGVGEILNTFYVWDLDNPDTDPIAIDTGDDGPVTEAVWEISGNYIMYLASVSGGDQTKIINIADGSITTLPIQPSASTLAIGGATYVYTLRRDSEDSFATVSRTATGSVSDLGATAAGDDEDDPWRNFAGDACVTADGGRIFIAGNSSGGVNTSAEFLQWSGGGAAFSSFATGDTFLTAVDPNCSANLVAFKIGANNDTFLGYIILGN